MAQMALISHVAYLKFKDDEDRAKKENDSPGRDVPGTGSRVPIKGNCLNKGDKDNAQAFWLISSGLLN